MHGKQADSLLRNLYAPCLCGWRDYHRRGERPGVPNTAKFCDPCTLRMGMASTIDPEHANDWFVDGVRIILPIELVEGP